jgi:hypothetical protein
MDPSLKFVAMAEKIKHNQDGGFGGAAVVVPPPGGGEDVEILVLTPRADPVMFWTDVATLCKEQLDLLEQRRTQGFGMAR